MKTNSKEVRAKVCAYIIATVYDDNENAFKTFEQAAKFLHDDFKRVANHPANIHNFPNVVARFDDYLQSAPFFFPVWDDEVTDFLNSLGINPQGKKFDGDKSRRLFANLIYREIEKY